MKKEVPTQKTNTERISEETRGYIRKVLSRDTELVKVAPLPHEMTKGEFIKEYDTLMRTVAEKEKKGKLDPDAKPYVPVSLEEQVLLEKDWKAFSRQRGFSEEDITEYERWMLISGQTDSLKGAINDPWRRSRPNWAETLWKLHIENAMKNGLTLPKEVRQDYETSQKTLPVKEGMFPAPMVSGQSQASAEVW